jgi:hypothetical protein
MSGVRFSQAPLASAPGCRLRRLPRGFVLCPCAPPPLRRDRRGRLGGRVCLRAFGDAPLRDGRVRRTASSSLSGHDMPCAVRRGGWNCRLRVLRTTGCDLSAAAPGRVAQAHGGREARGQAGAGLQVGGWARSEQAPGRCTDHVPGERRRAPAAAGALRTNREVRRRASPPCQRRRRPTGRRRRGASGTRRTQHRRRRRRRR